MKAVAVRKIERLEPQRIYAFDKLGVAAVHEAQSQSGLLASYIRPVFSGAHISGSVVTVLAQPRDNWMLHVAIELCQPGDVLVVGMPNVLDDQKPAGLFGDLLATSAKAHGIKALIIDSGVRDVAELERMNFPVWSRAISAQGTVKQKLGAVNVPIICAGQLVYPGDIVVADDDGVVIVPRKSADDILQKAQDREANELDKRKRFARGELGLDMYNMRPSLEEAGLVYLDSLDKL